MCVFCSCTSTYSASATTTPASPTEPLGEVRGKGDEEEEKTSRGERKPSRGSATPPREDQVDAVFLACDDGSGRVSAGHLADALSARLSELQPRWLVGELRCVLCSGGEDALLDLTTFRQLLFTWLQEHAADLISSTSPDPLLAPSQHHDALSTPDSDNHHQRHSSFQFLGPLTSYDPLEEWLKNSPDTATPAPPPTPPPPPPPPRAFKNSFEHHLWDDNRRSTLLPRVGGWGAASDEPPFTPLDMANPPSPISLPRPLFNGGPPPPPPRPPRLSPDEDGRRSFNDDKSDHHHHHQQRHLQNSLNYTYGSLEDEGGVTSPDPGELQQEVLELSHTNKRLAGKNHELTTHLNVAEETNANLREQCANLRHALRGVQQNLEAARAFEAELEAARRQVEEGKEERDQLLNRLAHLERDNTSLSTRLNHLNEQLTTAHEEIDGHTQQEEEAVRRHREEVSSLSSQLAHWKAQAETQTLTAYRLRETLEDVKKLVEVLKEEKRSLEEQLDHVKEELAAATHTESDMSGLEGGEGVTLDSSSPNKSSDGSGRDSSVGIPSLYSSASPFGTTPIPSGASVTRTPQTAITQPSPFSTSLSIHSEIHTMGEDSGSLPFCEKTDGGNTEERQSGSPSEAGETPLAPVLSSMLRWWREWEEKGIPLLRAMLDRDTATLHNHIATHYEELVRLERELHEIRQATQSSPTTSGMTSLEEALKEGSVSSAQDSALPSSQATTPTLPQRRPRTPGSHVSQLIYLFESSSQSSSPVQSEGSVEHPASLSRMIQRAKWKRRMSSDETRSESTNSDDGGSLEAAVNLRDSLENVRCEKGSQRSTDICDGGVLERGSEGVMGSGHSDKEACVYVEYGLEQDIEENETAQEIQIHPYTIAQNKDQEDEAKNETAPHTFISAQRQGKEEAAEEGGEGMDGSTTVVGDHDLEPETDPYMETSHLMKLMNEVADQRGVIVELRKQVVDAEDEKEKYSASLERLHRLALQVSLETFRWTEGVRREWLAVVVPRVGGRGEEGEGAESLTPATPTHPLDEVPLTTSFSREEIEALITARRDPPACEARPREDDKTGHVSSPETLAAELERELTALRVHVLRSHALLHHYQSSSSSSQYGSRAEVSTPAPPPLHVQGVEVGVECDLCGPTCVPRPCDSTATQTPASPLSSTPDSEEPPSTSHLAVIRGRHKENDEEEEEEEPKEEEQEEEQEEEEEEEEDGARDRRQKTHQQRVKWKEDLEEEEAKEEEEDIDEGTAGDEKELLIVGGGAKDPHHAPLSPQRPPQQPQQQQPPALRQVGILDLPEHRQLRQVEVVPPAHRILLQLGVGQEEEEEQEAALGVEGVEIIPMTSEHSLYSPKPAYDHLDHYRSGGQVRRPGEEKHRRTGLATVSSQVHAVERGELPSGFPRRPRAQMDLTPLSPPPSLDNVEEEDMEEEEEEPALPSTPESSSSLASGDMFPHPPAPPRGPPRLPRQMSMSAPDPPPGPSKRSPPLHPLPEAESPPAPSSPHQEQETPEEATQEEAPQEEVKKKRVFPSLHDTVLRMAGLARGDPVFTPNENLSPQEIETKFTQLSLAFKTDRLTLRQRLDLQQRHRDTAENNHEEDMDCLRRLVLEIQADCMDNELADSISQVRRHLDVLTASSTRLVSTSEVWGAVQQEWRLARAVEVIFRHVEDVKRKYEGVKQELEELKRLLTEYQIELPGSNASGGSGGSGSNNQGGTDSPSTSRRLRALSLAVCSNKAGTEKESRRTSIAMSKTSSGGLSMARSRGRRASLMPDLKPFREPQLAAFVAVANATNAAAKESSSSSSSSSGSSLGALKERGEEGSGSSTAPTGRLHSCITEEVSESGEEEGGGSTQESDATSTATNPSSGSYSNLSPLSPDTLSHLQAIAEGRRGMDDSDDGESDDLSQSDISQESFEYREPPPPSFTTSLWNRLGSEHWLLEAFKEVLAWAKGGQWPYSQQQTVLGARYAFTSLLLLAAALFLLVTLSSGDASAPQPRHPGWTTIHHILHPFVTMRYLEPPPT